MLDITEARVSATRQMLMKIRESEEDAPSAELVQWKQAFIRASQAWTDVLKGDREVAKGVLQMAKDYRGFHFFSEEVVEPNPWGDVPLKDRLVGVGVPVCVMVGERDTPDFQEIADEIWEGVPHAWGDGVIKVPECGHFAVVEQHRAVAQRIAQFWGSLEDQRAGVEATAAEPEQKQT